MFNWYDKEMGWKWNVNSFYRMLTRPFKNFFRWIVKSIQYSIFLWNDIDWDYAHILLLLQYKLKRVRKCIEENNIIVRRYEIGAQIKHAVDMIDKHFDDAWTDDLQEAHDKKWGERISLTTEKVIGGKTYHIFDPQREKAVTEDQKKQERQEQREIDRLDDKLREENLDRLFKHIRAHIESWWD